MLETEHGASCPLSFTLANLVRGCSNKVYVMHTKKSDYLLHKKVQYSYTLNIYFLKVPLKNVLFKIVTIRRNTTTKEQTIRGGPETLVHGSSGIEDQQISGALHA